MKTVGFALSHNTTSINNSGKQQQQKFGPKKVGPMSHRQKIKL